MRAIILTHLSDPKLGADENLLRVRMAYETVKMEPNDVLKYYYQRFKALKTGYDDTKRVLGIEPVYTPAMTIHENLLTGMKFMKQFGVQTVRRILRARDQGLARFAR